MGPGQALAPGDGTGGTLGRDGFAQEMFFIPIFGASLFKMPSERALSELLDPLG